MSQSKNWKEKLKKNIKQGVKRVLLFCFKVQVNGEYQPATSAVIIANRTSVIDVLLLSIFLPEQLTVTLHPQIYKKMWVRCLMMFTNVIPIDPSSAKATRALIKAIRAGNRCIIFPEGLLAATDGNLKLYDGPAIVLQKVGAEVVPIRIDGPQRSIFSISKDKNRIQLFPQFILNIQSPQSLASPKKGAVDRYAISMRLFKLMSELSFLNLHQSKSLFSALIDGVSLGTKHSSVIEDSSKARLNFRQFIARCFILGRQIKRQTATGEYVGVMMPTTVAGMVTFFALHAYRRIPAMLNFSMGFYNLFAACETAGIKTIYTSRQFIQTAKLDDLVNELQEAGLTIRYLEAFKSSVHLGHKISGVLKGYFPALVYRLIGKVVSADDKAIVLFTSGSEGIPKGVVLSHANLLANCYQMMSRVDFSNKDRFFNALPIFHCFGLTAGSILPLINGLNCYFYPSPLHYKIIPGLIYQTGATIMFGTDTFLTGYARAADNHDFSGVRYIFAGAEKVKPETIRYWIDTFGVKIYEGYGATETAPVISLNCTLASITGTVGMILPFMESRIEPIDGIDVGGRLFLKGPNVMLGYIRSDNSRMIDAPPNGWYDTGDIVDINEHGFITIIGRAKRFAKIAGEMVSLTAVEGIAASVWPEVLHAAISQKCPKRGEQILLFSESTAADKMAFIKKVHELGYSELLVPQNIFPESKIPVLPSGKIDYMRLVDEYVSLEKTADALQVV
jgi:acyl-[acyl-carrier-protein]-phospholipid O-acyltransferase / long-chain-fatty-acid--[acyl-carrier-protein] ligase